MEQEFEQKINEIIGATGSVSQKIARLKLMASQAKKWNDLYDKVAPFYPDNDSEEDGQGQEGSLIEIGEIAATHLGFIC